MDENLTHLLLQAIFYASLNISLRIFLRQPLICAGLAFWTGWIFLISGGLVAINENWINIRTHFAFYLSVMFDGALAGFLLATPLAAARKPHHRYQLLVGISKRFFDKFGKKVLIALLVVGTIFFLQRVATIGFSIDYLTTARDAYNERSGSLLLQIGAHLSFITTMFVILRGVYDSYYGVDVRIIFLIILCGAPLGLANAGRTFLMSYLLAYLASLLLSRAHFLSLRFILTLREIKAVGTMFLSLITIFAIMGYLRGGYGDKLDIFYTILIWPVSTLGAMDSWVFSATTSERTYGINTFGWVVDFLARVGLIDISDASRVLGNTLYYFQSIHDSAAVVPRSILPDLIFDFGPDAIFPSMMILAISLEILVSRFAGYGIFLHVLAVQCLVASFTTIQNSVVSPGFAATIFWAAVFSQFVKYHRG